jgi:type IV pilus assembly protein PilA
MLTSIKQRLDRDDEGFTLIELMVVVLIIAILLAIAIPTFLGARNSANARAAQSNLRNALTAEQTYFTNNQVFDSSTTDMAGVESALNWVNTAPSKGNTVDVAVGPGPSVTSSVVELSAFGQDGNCYYILQSDDPQNSFTGYAMVKQNSAGTCPQDSVPAVVTANAGTTVPQAGNATKNGGAAGTAPAAVSNFYTSW